MSTDTLSAPEHSESIENTRQVEIGNGLVADVWDKVGDKVSLLADSQDDPLDLPFFITTENIGSDGKVEQPQQYVVVGEVIINLGNVAAEKPDSMLLADAIAKGIISPALEIGKPTGTAGTVDSVLRLYGPGVANDDQQPSDSRYANTFSSIDSLLYEKTGLGLDEIAADRYAKLTAEGGEISERAPSSVNKLIDSEVVWANVDKLLEGEMSVPMVEAYLSMLQEHPELANVLLEPNLPGAKRAASSAEYGRDGEHTVHLRLDRQYYTQLLAEPAMKDRFARFVKLSEEIEDAQLDEAFLAKAILLHEFGHIVDYESRKAEKPTFNNADFKAFNTQQRKSEVRTLPLKMPALKFMDLYSSADEQKKASMRKYVGARDDEEIGQFFAETARGYGQLPSEAAPDNFALQQLKAQLGSRPKSNTRSNIRK